MTRNLRFWRSSKWRKALQVDIDLAEAEGRAAGTGLLTGDLARRAPVAAGACPRCEGPGDPTVVDLVSNKVVRRCTRCDQTWTSHEHTDIAAP